jgi:hypothetical protein
LVIANWMIARLAANHKASNESHRANQQYNAANNAIAGCAIESHFDLAQILL